jgi:hypothetical protein
MACRAVGECGKFGLRPAPSVVEDTDLLIDIQRVPLSIDEDLLGPVPVVPLSVPEEQDDLAVESSSDDLPKGKWRRH